MQFNKPRVAIIILNWNSYEDTSACLRSLQKIEVKSFEPLFIIVDNGSTDGSFEIIEAELDNDTVIIRNDKNEGFAQGNNIGIEYALQNDCNYILLINNDTVVDRSFLEQLLVLMETKKDAGLVGGKIYYFVNPNQLWYAGGDLNKLLCKTIQYGMLQQDRGQFDSVSEVTFITGCLMLIRREVFEKIGAFDSKLFLYYEDVDFCLRARKNNFKLYYCPQSKIWHKVGAGKKDAYSPCYLYYQTRNRALVLTKDQNIVYRTYFHFFNFFIFVMLRIFIILFSKSVNKMKQIIAIAHGFGDSLLKRFGSREIF